MKKNFIKKLALVMALTVAATSVPATNAEAASTPNFRSKAANLTVGQTKNYGVTDGSRWSVKFKIGNTKIATIDWKQGDKKVAVTGEAEGTTTLRADFKAYKTKRTHTERIKVYVKPAEEVIVKTEMTSATQKSYNTINAIFNQELTAAEFTAADFAVKDLKTGIVQPVNFVTLSDDAKTVYVTMHLDFIDGDEIQVTYKGENVASFVAKAGAVDKVAFVGGTVVNGKYVDLSKNVTLYDANGVDVTSQANMAWVTYTSDNGFVDGNKLYLYNAGEVANVTATYAPGKYEADGTPIIKEAKAVYTAVDFTNNKVVSIADATVTTATSIKAVDFDAPNATTLGLTDVGYKLVVKANTADGKTVLNSLDDSEFKFSTTNNSVLFVDENGLLTPVNKGTVAVKVTWGDSFAATVNVTVGAERKLAAFTADKYSVVLSDAGAAGTAVDSASVKVKAVDQYGHDYSANTTFTSTTTPIRVSGSGLAVTNATGTTMKYTFAPNTATGAALFRVTVEAADNNDGNNVKKQNVNVTVNESGAMVNVYEARLGDTTIDSTYHEDLTGAETLTVDVFAKDRKGNVVSKATAGDFIYTCIKQGAKYVAPTTTASDNAIAMGTAVRAVTNIGALVTTDEVTTSGMATERLEAGNYIVRVYAISGDGTTVLKNKVISQKTFTVTDTMTMPTLDIAENLFATPGTALAAAQSVITAIPVVADRAVTISGATVLLRNREIDDTDPVVAGDNIYVRNVKVTESFAGGVTVTHTIPVNRTIIVR